MLEDKMHTGLRTWKLSESNNYKGKQNKVLLFFPPLCSRVGTDFILFSQRWHSSRKWYRNIQRYVLCIVPTLVRLCCLWKYYFAVIKHHCNILSLWEIFLFWSPFLTSVKMCNLLKNYTKTSAENFCLGRCRVLSL